MSKLPKALQDKWDEAERTGERVDVGRLVVCDHCDADFTDSTESGGFIFGSYGYCPRCAPKQFANIHRYGEERYIKAQCPDGKSFADFIREYRGERGNYIRISNK